MFTIDSFINVPLNIAAGISALLFIFLLIIKLRNKAKVSLIFFIATAIMLVGTIYSTFKEYYAYIVFTIIITEIVLLPYLIIKAFINEQKIEEKRAAKKAAEINASRDNDMVNRAVIQQIEEKNQRYIELNRDLIAKLSTFFTNNNSMENFLEYCNDLMTEKVKADGCIFLIADDYDNTLAVKSFKGAFPPPYKLPAQVAYKETIRSSADVDERYVRQSGGKGQYGHVKLKVEPNEPGKGYEFVNAIVGGAIPKEFIPAVDQGIQGAMLAGVLAGFPVVDVKVTLYDGSFHEVDSSELAFKIAGSIAFKEACRKADPVILEPIMKVCVVVPEEYMGDVMGDITGRRGSILGMEPRNGATQIDAQVPLSEMFGYATDLRGRTQGRGTYSMEPSHYIQLPRSIQDELLLKRGRY